MKNKVLKFCQDQNECILIIMFVLAIVISAIVLFSGCKQEDKIIETYVPKYEDITMSKIKIVRDSKIKEYEAFSDAIYKDDANNYTGFAANKHEIQKDSEGNVVYENIRIIWVSSTDETILIESLPNNFKRLDSEEKKEKILSLYCSARGVKQMNVFLYEKDLKDKKK